jgi:hypothetical protein
MGNRGTTAKQQGVSSFEKNERKCFLSKLKSYVLFPPNHHHAIHCHIPKIEQIEKEKTRTPDLHHKTDSQTDRLADSRSECVKSNNNNSNNYNNNNYYYYYNNNNNCVILFITHTLQVKVW